MSFHFLKERSRKRPTIHTLHIMKQNTNNEGNEETDSQNAEIHIAGSAREILIAFAVMSIPMILFSGLLLGLIFHYRIVHKGFVSKELVFATSGTDSGSFYVKLSSSTLITVASWSSTLAPILCTFAITLISFPVARDILRAAQGNHLDQLPTPYQFFLLLRMISSPSLPTLWNWLRYTFNWKAKRQSQGKPIKSMASILALGILLSAFVFIADTWLHFTTKTVLFVQVSPDSAPMNHSFILRPKCTNVTDEWSSAIRGCSMIVVCLSLEYPWNISSAY